MLVLTRHCGEVIVIGKQIRIKVLQCHGQIVRLGIEAPKQFSVHREEIYDRISAGKGMDHVVKKPRIVKEKVERKISDPGVNGDIESDIDESYNR